MMDMTEIIKDAEEVGFEIAKTKCLSVIYLADGIDPLVRRKLAKLIEEKVRLER